MADDRTRDEVLVSAISRKMEAVQYVLHVTQELLAMASSPRLSMAAQLLDRVRLQAQQDMSELSERLADVTK